MTDDQSRPFYRLGARLFLGPIPGSGFLSFLERAFRRSGFDLREGGCRRVLDLAAGVPYNVQRLAAEVPSLEVRPPGTDGAAPGRPHAGD